jgi:hypothetical protein
MWDGSSGTISNVEQDPSFIREMIERDGPIGADAVLTFALTAELPGISKRSGIFAQRIADPSLVATAEKEGFPSGVLQGLFPGECFWRDVGVWGRLD